VLQERSRQSPELTGGLPVDSFVRRPSLSNEAPCPQGCEQNSGGQRHDRVHAAHRQCVDDRHPRVFRQCPCTSDRANAIPAERQILRSQFVILEPADASLLLFLFRFVFVQFEEPDRPRLRHVLQLMNGFHHCDDHVVVRLVTSFELRNSPPEVCIRCTLRSCTNARTTYTLISTARALLRTIAAMMAPCSVNA